MNATTTTHAAGMALVLREVREFLGTPGTVKECYEDHTAYLCRRINEALAGPPAAPEEGKALAGRVRAVLAEADGGQTR